MLSLLSPVKMTESGKRESFKRMTGWISITKKSSTGIPVCFVGKTINEQDMLDALSISGMSYNIERIGDNATNIAEAAIYLMEGKNAKHIT